MRIFSLTTSFGICLMGSSLVAQPPAAPRSLDATEKPRSTVIEISHDPLTVDPATSVPAILARRVTVEFKETPLKDVVKWLQSEQKLAVVVDQQELKDADIQLNDPVTEKLTDDPLYLLLDRVKPLGIGWYYENQLLHITTFEAAETVQQTSHLNIGDLLDAGYDGDAIIDTITSTTAGPWNDIDGDGGEIALLGDVLFLKQTSTSLREVEGLLNAIRKHGQRTFAFDSPKHAVVREALQKPVSISWEDAKLSAILADLSRQSGVEFRFDRDAEKNPASLDRTPLSIELSKQKLQTVLEVVLNKLNLAWILKDGVLWITSSDEANNLQKAAVFDVRDLCGNELESSALSDAVQRETHGPWQEIDGSGGDISFPRPGTMVIRARERLLDEVLELLENYRTALRASKPRTRPGRDPKEVVVRFYKLPEAMAKDLFVMLPELVRPQTWKTADRQEAVGSLRVISLGPALLRQADGSKEKAELQAAMVSQSALVVTQTREVQREVAEILIQLKLGAGLDESDMDQPGRRGGGGLGGGGGGSFGGGFFQVPSTEESVR